MRSMKMIALLILMTLTLLVMGASALLGQPNSELTDLRVQDFGQADPQDLQYNDLENQSQTPYEHGAGQQESIKYSTAVSSDTPIPVIPTSPESIGLQMPSEPTTSYRAPPTEETERDLISVDESSVRSVQEANAGEHIDNQAQTMVVAPSGVEAPNRLFIYFVPQTVASCYQYGWLPLWLQVFNSGPMRFYEWYPNGRLDTKHLGYSNQGWEKAWFYGDASGWHILQYYSGGWSNYIYIYVYGGKLGYPNEPSPSPWPYRHDRTWQFNNQPALPPDMDVWVEGGIPSKPTRKPTNIPNIEVWVEDAGSENQQSSL